MISYRSNPRPAKRTTRFIHGEPEDNEILLLWRGGKDTYDISKQLWIAESHVANRLPRILERARQDEEWNFDRDMVKNND